MATGAAADIMRVGISRELYAGHRVIQAYLTAVEA